MSVWSWMMLVAVTALWLAMISAVAYLVAGSQARSS